MQSSEQGVSVLALNGCSDYCWRRWAWYAEKGEFMVTSWLVVGKNAPAFLPRGETLDPDQIISNLLSRQLEQLNGLQA